MEHTIIDEAKRIYSDFLSIIQRGYPGAVYLPVFYRATPPYIFLLAWGIRALVSTEEVNAWRDRAAIFLERDYRYIKKSTFHLIYRFEDENDFFLPLDGVELVKELAGEEMWLEELGVLRAKLGVFRLVPIVSLEECAEDMGDTREGRTALRIKRLDKDVRLPFYAHPGDAGLDLYSAENISIGPGEWALISTGFAMALEEGYAAFVQPRSGLAARYGISIVNTPGLIDCHYRGEVKIILINHGKETFQVKRGDRIAQMVVQRVESVTVEEVDELDDTPRGEGGFGSTGV